MHKIFLNLQELREMFKMFHKITTLALYCTTMHQLQRIKLRKI